MERRIVKNEDDIKVVRKETTNIRNELKKKTSNEETLRVWKKFDDYAEYRDLKDLYGKVMPQLRKFEDALVSQTSENMKVQAIVGRFDEVLSEKASKQIVREVIEKFDNYLLTSDLIDYKAQNSSRLADIVEKLDKLDHYLDELGLKLTNDIYTAIRKATSHLKSKSDGNNAFSISEDELRKAIDSKADKQELQDLAMLKSNKKDTERIISWIELLHKFLKNLSVL